MNTETELHYRMDSKLVYEDSIIIYFYLQVLY